MKLLAYYMDEAGGKKDNFTVVGGWISTVPRWEQFEVDWKLLLAAYDLPYFHMMNFSQSTGPFKKWQGQKAIRAKFLGDAADIIRSRVQGAIFCFVHHRIFEMANQRYKISETLSSPYAVAGRICVAQADQWRRKVGAPSDTEYIFEDGGPDKDGLLRALKLDEKLPDPIFRPGRDIKDKKGNTRKGAVALQASDFLVYELRKHRRELAERTGRPGRRSFHEILKVRIIFMAVFNEKNATSLCRIGELSKR